eukprot:jgi/Mesvir1/9265/Mv03130-RA.1
MLRDGDSDGEPTVALIGCKRARDESISAVLLEVAEVGIAKATESKEMACNQANLALLNSKKEEDAIAEVLRWTGSPRLAELLVRRRPYQSVESLSMAMHDSWWTEVGVPGWLDAFKSHPRIGDVASLRKKYGATADLCEGEQSAALASANEQTLQELAAWNGRYERKFGHVFLIFATGKSSTQVLAEIQRRFPLGPVEELVNAATQHIAIAQHRMATSLSASANPPTTTSALSESGTDAAATRRVQHIGAHVAPNPCTPPVAFASASTTSMPVSTAPATAAPLRSPITTHVLDTARGAPARGIPVELALLRACPGALGGSGALMVGGKPGGFAGGTSGRPLLDASTAWQVVGTGVTNEDGRVASLMPPSHLLAPGTYRITFDTQAYLESLVAGGSNGSNGAPYAFYPCVPVYFVNTMLAYERSVHGHHSGKGTEVLEFDLRMTKDGVIVLMHDPVVDSTTDGHGFVEDFTLAQIKQLDAGYKFSPDGGLTHPYRGQSVRVPTLDEVLQAFAPLRHLCFFFDFKSVSSVRPGLEAISKWGLDHRVIAGALGTEVSRELHTYKPSYLPTGPSWWGMLRLYILYLLGLLWLVPLRTQLVGCVPILFGRKVLTQGLVDAFHKRQRIFAVFGPYLNTEDHQMECISLGVDILVTDMPDCLHHTLEKWGIKEYSTGRLLRKNST